MQNRLLLVLLIVPVFTLPARAQYSYSSDGKGFNSSTPPMSRPSPGYPIGTASGGTANPVYWGALSTPIAPANGVVAPGFVNLYNNPGLGYFRVSPYSQQFPAYPAPVNLGGGYFQFGGAGSQNGYWRAPSGYYYPWCPAIYLPNVAYPAIPQILAMQQGVLTQAKPAVSMIINDMRQFIDDAHNKKQLDQNNYEFVFNRLNNVTSMTAELSAKNSGVLDSSDEATVRRELDLISTDIARALNP